MKYTFQQRKYVFNRLANAITERVIQINNTPRAENTKAPKMVSRVVTSQLLKSELTFTFPKTHAAKLNRALDDLEKLEESMFLAGAPELQEAMNKLQTKIGSI